MLNEFMVSKVATVLFRADGRSLGEVTNELAVSRPTAIKWLRSMEREGLLYRSYNMKGKKGRPKGIYHPTKNLKRFVDTPQGNGSMVTLSFTTMKSICRYHTGGMCKALIPKLQRCDSSLCPYLKA